LSRNGTRKTTLTTTIGCTEGGGPLCAQVPLLPCFTEGYPSSIRSFRLIHPEERNNSAHHCRTTITPLGGERPLCASLPILISGWSPEPRLSAPGCCTDAVYAPRSVVYTRVYLGDHGMELVYTRCIPGWCIAGCTPPIPGWCIAGCTPPIPGWVVYTSPIPGWVVYTSHIPGWCIPPVYPGGVSLPYTRVYTGTSHVPGVYRHLSCTRVYMPPSHGTRVYMPPSHGTRVLHLSCIRVLHLSCTRVLYLRLWENNSGLYLRLWENKGGLSSVSHRFKGGLSSVSHRFMLISARFCTFMLPFCPVDAGLRRGWEPGYSLGCLRLSHLMCTDVSLSARF